MTHAHDATYTDAVLPNYGYLPQAIDGRTYYVRAESDGVAEILHVDDATQLVTVYSISEADETLADPTSWRREDSASLGDVLAALADPRDEYYSLTLRLYNGYGDDDACLDCERSYGPGAPCRC